MTQTDNLSNFLQNQKSISYHRGKKVFEMNWYTPNLKNKMLGVLKIL